MEVTSEEEEEEEANGNLGFYMEGLPSGIYIKAFVIIYSVHDTCDDVNTTTNARIPKNRRRRH